MAFFFMTTTVHVFNQYYWDFLKKTKNVAKDVKYKASDNDARLILSEIKKSYMSFDKTANDHVEWYREHVKGVWDTFATGKSTMESWKNWHEVAGDEVLGAQLYKGITVGNILNIYKSRDVVLYYCLLLSVFANDQVTTEHVSAILDILRKRAPLADDELSFMNDEFVATTIRLLHTMSLQSNTSAGAGSSKQDNLISELENTTLGKLAKEIMEDVDVSNIQESLGDGDILKAFADPNGQMSKLIGTVTQKMVSKLASGELKQDTLLSDAMKLAGSLPGAGGGGMFDQIGKMASMFGGGGDGDDDGFDIASMMKNMMGGGKGGGGGGGAGARGTRAVINSPALTRNVKAKQLRRKLDERRKAKENIETQVGDQ